MVKGGGAGILVFGHQGSTTQTAFVADRLGLSRVDLDSKMDLETQCQTLRLALAGTPPARSFILDGIVSSAEEAEVLDRCLEAAGRSLTLAIQLRVDADSAEIKTLADYYRKRSKLRRVQAIGDPEDIFKAVRKLILALGEPELPEPWTPAVPASVPEAAVGSQRLDTQPEAEDESVEPNRHHAEDEPAWKRAAAERKARAKAGGRKGRAIRRRPGGLSRE